ncbi:MAG: alpha/beta fold hydrolase [Acidobacteria bacterium]|nr:alpha/beta fold hydrolase [Acidobacteriota bacterium]
MVIPTSALIGLLCGGLAFAAPTLILVPGSWNDRQIFAPYIRHLQPGVEVRVIELPGHGAGPMPANPTIEGLADHVLKSARGLDDFYVGGHSIGAMIAIEIAGRKPKGLRGIVPIEGWIHHSTQLAAFPSDKNRILPPDVLAHRHRIRATLTPQEIQAFGSAWRKWDGSRILAASTLPILSIWGDRGLPRPDREQLKIPDRPNIELVWIEGAGHSMLLSHAEALARETSRFLAANMYAPLEEPRALPSEAITVFRGVEHTNGFNMHPYIAWHAGRFWAMWSTNRVRDLQSGQYVRYATSADGVHWSAPRALTPSEEGFRSFARGFWIRNGELIALAARDEAVRPLFGPGLELRGYKWNGTRFGSPIVVARDAINNFPPRQMPSGEWLFARRDHRMNLTLLRGGVRSESDWTVVDVPRSGANLDEPEWWLSKDGNVQLAFRDGDRSRRLYRSVDFGRPVKTNFPDAMAKFNVLRLAGGRYALASNPNTSGVRIPLALSLSPDGVVFDRTFLLRDSDTTYRYAGKDPGYRGYHYPQLLERDGWLYIIHAENMEDIVLLRLRTAALR